MKLNLFFIILLSLSFMSCAKLKTYYQYKKNVMNGLDDNSVEGPDKDQNGIRDDIDLFVKERIENKYLKMAFSTQAKYVRKSILEIKDKDKSSDNAILINNAVQCRYLIFRDENVEVLQYKDILSRRENIYKDQYEGEESSVYNYQGRYRYKTEEEKKRILKDYALELGEKYDKDKIKYKPLEFKARLLENWYWDLSSDFSRQLYNTSERREVNKKLLELKSGIGIYIALDPKQVCDFKYKE